MTQEATVRACRSVNPGIIILGIPRTASNSHFEFCMTLCTWQHERGALCIMILTNPEDALSEEQCVALKTLHRSEGSACLGRDVRQAGTGARLDSNLPAMSLARVWTNSFTVAEHVQQEAIAREGPLYSEELFHLLRTVIQGEALSRAMQFAQILRDTADEELVTPLGNFVAAAYRERDLVTPFPTVSTITTKRFSPPLLTFLIPASVSFPAIALAFAFPSSFLLSFLSFSLCLFLSPLLSLDSFLCRVPSHATIHTNQVRARLHQSYQQSYSPLQSPLAAFEERKLFVIGTSAGETLASQGICFRHLPIVRCRAQGDL